jgi:hypothetical protein
MEFTHYEGFRRPIQVPILLNDFFVLDQDQK